MIGQAATSAGQQRISKWGVSMNPARFDLSGFVTMLGGEYSFAPSTLPCGSAEKVFMVRTAARQRRAPRRRQSNTGSTLSFKLPRACS